MEHSSEPWSSRRQNITYSGDLYSNDQLVNSLKAMCCGGMVTCCGNVASPELCTTVYPFILRGVSLIGIDSVHCSRDIRLKLWKKLASDCKLKLLDSLCSEITLDELDSTVERMLKGQLTGRTVINLEE